MSHYWRLALTEELRDIMAKLQAPIPDQYLSWKPGNTFEMNNEWYGIYFPYINREFLEERLDNVLGLDGWNTQFDVDTQGVCHCHLTLHLPQERKAIRHGVGTHKGKDADEEKAEADGLHGSQTRAFRDACRIFGICGRDIVNTQTRPVKVKPGKVENGRAKYCTALEPLTRALLVHSGASTYKGDGYHRGTVRAGMEGHSGIRDPEAASKEVDKDIKITDTDLIMFPFGKHKGEPLSQVPSAYLDWCMKNTKALDPQHKDYDSFLYDAICIALDKKAKAKAEKQVAQVTNQSTPSESQLEMLFDGGAVSTPEA